eukprot:g39786.t1
MARIDEISRFLFVSSERVASFTPLLFLSPVTYIGGTGPTAEFYKPFAIFALLVFPRVAILVPDVSPWSPSKTLLFRKKETIIA